MKTALRNLPFILLLSGVVGLFGLTRLREAPPSRGNVELAPSVETQPVAKCEEGFSIWIDGEVIPYREISLASQVKGRVIKKTEQARAGRYVGKGDLLFQVDKQDYLLALRRLQETVEQAGISIEEADVEKSNVEQLMELAQEQLRLQRADLRRFEDLRSRNAASDSQLETARQAELTSLNSLQTLKNQVTLISARRNRLVQEKERALTDLEQAELDLKRTEIRSPIDGIVIQDLAEADDYVQPGSGLVQLEDTSKVEVRFSLRMEKLRWLWRASPTTPTAVDRRASYLLPSVPVRVHLEIDGHRYYWTARLDRYDGAGINAGTRTAPIIAIVDDPTNVQELGQTGDDTTGAPPALLRGTFVSVEIPVGSSVELLTIPSRALRPGGRVWTWQEGKLSVERVRVAHTTDKDAILVWEPNRLAAGDEVITSPLPFAIDGMEIRREQQDNEAIASSQDEARPDPL